MLTPSLLDSNDIRGAKMAQADDQRCAEHGRSVAAELSGASIDTRQEFLRKRQRKPIEAASTDATVP